MKPQELMDLPYCGMAEKQLRKQGDWIKSTRDAIEDLIGRVENIEYESASVAHDLENAWRAIDT